MTRCGRCVECFAAVIVLTIERPSQILVQIQQTAVQSQRNLNVARQQMAAKERERRILQLTIEEVTSLQGDVNLYKGVGKMCVCPLAVDLQTFLHRFPPPRFMNVPRPRMENDLRAEEKELTEDIKNLEKKVCSVRSCDVRRSDNAPQSKYLEKQFNDAQAQLRDIVSYLPSDIPCKT